MKSLGSAGISALWARIKARFIGQKTANGYPGMMTGAGNDTEWIRTTTSGIIPYKDGGASALGAVSWPFTAIYANDIYDGGVLLESKYAALSHVHAYLPVNGNAETATTASNLSYFKNTSMLNVGIDDTSSNGIGYVSGTSSILSQNDGALYRQAYNTSWVHQIYGDYRTGQIAVRGKSNGTWQGWRVVLDSSNYASYVPTYTHPTSAGNKHVPAGGSAGQILKWSAAGTAVWGAPASGIGVLDAWPVGSVFVAKGSAKNPAALLGGTWTLITTTHLFIGLWLYYRVA